MVKLVNKRSYAENLYDFDEGFINP